MPIRWEIIIPGINDFNYDDDGFINDHSISDASMKAIERVKFGINDLKYLFEMVKDEGGTLREIAYKCKYRIRFDNDVFRKLVLSLDNENYEISEFSRSALSSFLFEDLNSKKFESRRGILQYLSKDRNLRVKEYAEKQCRELEDYWYRED